MLSLTQQSYKWPAQPAQQQRTRKCPWHTPWEGHMIVVRSKELIDILSRDTMRQDVVYGLNIKRLFDFCVGRDEQVDQNTRWDEGVEGPCRERHDI